jgi:multicomponent Na+:H+ antiporter subunit D
VTIPLVLPILLPFAFAASSLIAWKSRRSQRILALIGGIAYLTVAILLLYSIYDGGIRVEQMGAWPAPFGITLVADLLSAIMVVMTGLMGLAGIIYSLGSVSAAHESHGYSPLFHVLLMGVNGACLTGDLFNLYVWFMASFALLALGGEKFQLEGALKYFTINLLSSLLFLTALGLLYGVVGTLNMADLAVKLDQVTDPGFIATLSIMFFVAFGIKAAIFPLFFWLPASYHTPPVAVSAVFAALLTKVGVYSLIRVFSLVFVQHVALTHTLILIVAGLTMLTGVLGAASQKEFRRILSFHIISQIGYMLMGLGLYTHLALTGTIFYIIHHIIVKANLFFISGIVNRLGGSFELSKLGGIYKRYPLVGILFLVPALSLAGLPPLSGFFGKLFLIKAGLDVESYAIVVTALVVSFFTLYSMTKIWTHAFWAETDRGELNAASVAEAPGRVGFAAMLAPAVLLALLTLCIGFGAGWVLELADAAAEQLLDRTGYIQAVMGGGA